MNWIPFSDDCQPKTGQFVWLANLQHRVTRDRPKKWGRQITFDRARPVVALGSFPGRACWTHWMPVESPPLPPVDGAPPEEVPFAERYVYPTIESYCGYLGVPDLNEGAKIAWRMARTRNKHLGITEEDGE